MLNFCVQWSYKGINRLMLKKSQLVGTGLGFWMLWLSLKLGGFLDCIRQVGKSNADD